MVDRGRPPAQGRGIDMNVARRLDTWGGLVLCGLLYGYARLRAALKGEPSLRTRVLESAARFRHFGEQVVGQVPVAMPGDPVAIATFARRIERLCGTRLVDHLKATL